jgi:two-component system, LytTR family, sensor histidine kinase AlgZ
VPDARLRTAGRPVAAHALSILPAPGAYAAAGATPVSRAPSGGRYLAPEFCRIPILFTTLVAAELVVVVIWLAPQRGELAPADPFFVTSTLALWLAVSCGVLLCKARGWLSTLPQALGALAAWAIPVLVTGIGSWLVVELEVVLLAGRGAEQSGEFALRNAAIAAVLTAFLLRYFHVQQQWLLNERAQARAAVDALQARIRPHFLFNSMNSIASLVRRDPVTAERAVEDLADLFRAALGASEGMATLKEELDLCQQYLRIEGLRLAERLRVNLTVEPDVPLDLPLPRLCLQPLVENAVHHGIARLPEGGAVDLHVQRRDRHVEVDILNPCPPAAAGSPGNRHATANIEQRLAYHFGSAARMTRGCHDGYYRCTVRLPLPS